MTNVFVSTCCCVSDQHKLALRLDSNYKDTKKNVIFKKTHLHVYSNTISQQNKLFYDVVILANSNNSNNLIQTLNRHNSSCYLSLIIWDHAVSNEMCSGPSATSCYLLMTS